MASTQNPRRLIVAITGATGAIYGIRALEMLRDTGVESHLVLSRWAARTLTHETPYTVEQVQRLATEVHAVGDQGAAISSGSFVTDGMLIAPCSMRTLAAIAHGLGDNLIHRAADVVLKERRKLVLAVREAPFHDIHLENMLKLSRMGVVISPPVPAFYHQPRTIDDVVNYTVVRLLDQFGIHVDTAGRWTGEMIAGPDPSASSGSPRPSSRGERAGSPSESAGSTRDVAGFTTERAASGMRPTRGGDR